MRGELFVVVVGCGRLGSYLANHLSSAGHSVVVIDSDERKFANLTPEFGGFRIGGDATELAVLKQAKTNKADLVVAATRSDNTNLMIAQIAKVEFGVSRVMARVFEPRREAVFQRLGIHTICPTLVAAEAFLSAVSKEIPA